MADPSGVPSPIGPGHPNGGGPRSVLSALIAAFVLAAPASAAQDHADATAPIDARAALRRAIDYFTSIATHGGWAGIYSEDLEQRFGEARYQEAKPTQIWVQPPGTPTVGEALLRAAQTTGERAYLDAAMRVGLALAWGQRNSGGWPYLADLGHVATPLDQPQTRPGSATLDDDTTQAALRFLLRLDKRVDAPWLRSAIERGLEFLRAAQFENGAWPQRVPLSGTYGDHYTFNDGTINDCIRTLLLAARLRGDERARAMAIRGGEFIVASQLDEPQAGWAQQYDADLAPAWARSFEPPGVCSAVTRRNIATLLELSRETGRRDFLAPIAAAVRWLERSALRDDVWARLYEIGTNRPIYGDRDRKVHYTLAEISAERRNGYSWESSFGIPATLRAWRERGKPQPTAQPRVESLRDRAQAIIAALDARGRWVAGGQITTRTFAANVTALCDYLDAAAKTRQVRGVRLSHGPMLGGVTDTTAALWLRTSVPTSVAIELRDGDGAVAGRTTHATNWLGGLLMTARFSGLAAGTEYSYTIRVADRIADRGSFRTFDSDSNAPVRIVFGSCFKPKRDLPGRASVFDAMAGREADAVLFLGDFPYTKMGRRLELRYEHGAIRGIPGFRELTRNTPTYAIWDDHDFGTDDSDGRNPFKDEALAAFVEHWPNPSYGTPDQEGIFGSVRVGCVELFLLDGRYHQLQDKKAPAMLGDAQLQWLLQRLSASSAPFKALVSGTPFTRNKKDAWGHKQHRRERDRILDHIVAQDIHGVVGMSGDIHRVDVHRIDLDRGRAFWDFTSSPLANEFRDAPKAKDRTAEMEFALGASNLFCELEFVPASQEAGRVVFRVFDGRGVLRYTRRLSAEDL